MLERRRSVRPTSLLAVAFLGALVGACGTHPSTVTSSSSSASSAGATIGEPSTSATPAAHGSVVHATVTLSLAAWLPEVTVSVGDTVDVVSDADPALSRADGSPVVPDEPVLVAPGGALRAEDYPGTCRASSTCRRWRAVLEGKDTITEAGPGAGGAVCQHDKTATTSCLAGTAALYRSVVTVVLAPPSVATHVLTESESGSTLTITKGELIVVRLQSSGFAADPLHTGWVASVPADQVSPIGSADLTSCFGDNACGAWTVSGTGPGPIHLAFTTVIANPNDPVQAGTPLRTVTFDLVPT